MLRQRFLVAAIATVVAFGLAEWAARRFAPPAQGIRLKQFARVVESRHDIAFEEIFINDVDRFWRLAPSVTLPDDSAPLFGFISNARGLREEREIPFAKPPGELRILFVGDSCTFGYLVPYADSVPELVEGMLRDLHPNRSIECINAGVPGYTVFQGLRFLESEGFEYEPDLVVLNFGWNAATPWGRMGDLKLHERRQATRPPRLVGWSRVCTLAWRKLAGVERAPRGEGNEAQRKRAKRPRLTPEEFRSVLDEIESATRREGVALFVWIGAGESNVDERSVPTEYQEQQYEFAAGLPLIAEGTRPFVDGVEIARRLARTLSADELFFDGVHTTPRVNAELARTIVSELEPWIGKR